MNKPCWLDNLLEDLIAQYDNITQEELVVKIKTKFATKHSEKDIERWINEYFIKQ